MISTKPVGNEVYTDFSGFEGMRKAARNNNPAAIEAVAKQLEGMFLNLMLSSMREANAVFTEDSLFDSKEVKFYQQMLDQQMSLSLSSGKGIGLAESLKQQLGAIAGKIVKPEALQEGSDQSKNASATQPSAQQALESYRLYALPVTNPEKLALNNLYADKPAEEVLPPDPQQLLSKSVTKVNPYADKTDFRPISSEDFLDKIIPYAQRAAHKLKVPVVGIIAQAALETGWGRHLMRHENGQPSFNLFGIKADKRWQGDRLNVNTLEYRNGLAAKETAAFRSYGSLKQGFDDYAEFLQQNPRYHSALAQAQQKNDPEIWGLLLQQAGYATDPEYGKKIASIVARLQKDGAIDFPAQALKR